MEWKSFLKSGVEYHYGVTMKLIDLLKESDLDWKPSEGHNWLTTGQLLMHLASACGHPMRGFATGDWSIPDGMHPKMDPESKGMSMAEAFPSVSSIAEARERIESDRRMALEVLDACTEERLNSEKVAAPWDPRLLSLGERMVQMLEHLNVHKIQLFYYLKLQGKPVGTAELWGM
jgi:hypothetical protein